MSGVPYYADDHVTLWHGDCRDILPTLVPADCVVTDPPYGETPYGWDRWPTGWLAAAAEVTTSLWCFGSLRLFAQHWSEFTEHFALSQDVVWQKHTGSGPNADRFRRVHEIATHWYRGRWREVYHQAQRVRTGVVERHRRAGKGVRTTGQRGIYGPGTWADDGTRLMTSVIPARSMNGVGALHPCHKPAGVLVPLIAYACPPGGLVLDPFAGSGATGAAARLAGRRAVLVEADERYCEVAATWLAQTCLPASSP